MDLSLRMIRDTAEKAGFTDQELSFRHWYECTSLKAGQGVFPLLTVDLTPETVQRVFRLAEELGLPVLPLGAGTDLLGCDWDLTALGVRSASSRLIWEGKRITADAPVMLGTLARRLPEYGLGGLTPLSGIPGTIGGALRMNAGAGDSCIASFLETAEYAVPGKNSSVFVSGSDPGWGYRTSPIPEDAVIISASFRFPEQDPETEKRLLDMEKDRRRRVTPPGGSAGSVFRNPAPGLPAGKLLEDAGCKGMGAGAFTVSQQHANWIVNPRFEQGRAEDCVTLIRNMRERVFRMSGILLVPEWKSVPGTRFFEEEKR